MIEGSLNGKADTLDFKEKIKIFKDSKSDFVMTSKNLPRLFQLERSDDANRMEQMAEITYDQVLTSFIENEAPDNWHSSQVLNCTSKLEHVSFIRSLVFMHLILLLLALTKDSNKLFEFAREASPSYKCDCSLFRLRRNVQIKLCFLLLFVTVPSFAML